MKKLIVSRHAVSRSRRRDGADERFGATLVALDRLACTKGLPNGSWYRPVRSRSGQILGYICGQGLSVTTTLAANMVPHGKQL